MAPIEKEVATNGAFKESTSSQNGHTMGDACEDGLNSLPVALAKPEVGYSSVITTTSDVTVIQPSEEDDSESNENSHDGSKIQNNRPSLISISFNKTDITTSLGIKLKNVDGIVEIVKIYKKSPLRKSPLKVGDELLSLDQFPCLQWPTGQVMNYLRDRDGG